MLRISFSTNLKENVIILLKPNRINLSRVSENEVSAITSFMKDIEIGEPYSIVGIATAFSISSRPALG
jgi:hypothetical protein